MASSALSARRGPLRRPKVCHASKNPGRCEPPPPPPAIVCTIEPDPSTGDVGTDIELVVTGCNSALPDDDPISAVLDGDGSTFTLNDAIVNCDGADAVCTSEVEGVFEISAELTFGDGSSCTATAKMTFEQP